MKKQFRTFYEKIVFIQVRMKDQIALRSSKIEVLYSAWDQVYASIMRKASSSRRKDRNVLDFLQQIARLDMSKRMKDEVLA